MVYPHAYRTEHSETQTSNNAYGDYLLGSQSNQIKIQPQLLKILQSIDSMKEKLIENLRKAIKIKSITSDVTYRAEVKKMVTFIEDWLKELGMKYEVFNIGYYYVEGKKIRLPPVIMATLGNDPNKKTLCAYGHLDVPRPESSEWDTDPWNLTVKDGFLYGNGAGCGKGPLMCWLHVLLSFKLNKMPLPVNFRFCIEMMQHQKSQGFLAFVNTKKQDFFNQIDFVAEVAGEWLGQKIPCIIYGTAGIVHMEITIEGDSSDSIKQDMEKIFATMVNDRMEIIIPHYADMVEQIGPDEEIIYAKIHEFDPKEIRESLPPFKRTWDRVRLLMHMWRLPSIFIDDIEECSCPNRDKKMIKRHFILKIVPRQTIDFTEEIVQKHITSVIKKNNNKNKVNVKCVDSVRPWVEDHNSFNHQAAKRAFIQIYKVDPNLIREDTGRETTAIFDSALEKNLVILPICSKGSRQGRGNEHISAHCFQEATKMLAAYMFQLAQKPKKPRIVGAAK